MNATATAGTAEKLPPLEPHYSSRTVADRFLEVSIPTVRRLERSGVLRSIRVAGQVRFPESAIREYLAEAAKAPRREPPPELLAAGGRPPKRGRR